MVLDGRGTSATFWTAASPNSSRQMSLAGGRIKSLPIVKGFPHSSVGKESACNEEDPGSIPGLGRSPGEGIGYPLQYSWASLMAQLVKNLPGKKKKRICLKCGRPGFNPWIGKIVWRRERLPIPVPRSVFWSGEFHGQSKGSQRVGHHFHFHFLNFSNTISHWE